MELPQGLGHPRMRITVPPGLSLLIFAAGAHACSCDGVCLQRHRQSSLLMRQSSVLSESVVTSKSNLPMSCELRKCGADLVAADTGLSRQLWQSSDDKSVSVKAAIENLRVLEGGVTPDAKNVPIPLLRREVTPPAEGKVRDHQVSFIGPVEGAARQVQ